MQISQVSEHAELLSREDQGAQTREALPPSRSPGWGERPWVRALPSFIRVDHSTPAVRGSARWHTWKGFINDSWCPGSEIDNHIK